MNPSLQHPRPALRLTGAEPLRAIAEYASNMFTTHDDLPRGDGHTVVLFPGLASDAKALGPLRRECQRLGYQTVDWGRGLNRGPVGDVQAWLDHLSADISALIEQDAYARPASLVGWSLGGIYAREVAKRLHSSVRQVITLGTPFNALTDHSRVGWLYELLSGQTTHMDDELRARLARAPAQPTTSIYSRSDGVVAWQTCTHESLRADVDDIEVSGSHLGMGWNPAILRVVAQRLARPVATVPSPRRPTTTATSRM